MTLGGRFDFFYLRLQLGQFATNTSCETFPFVPFEGCFHMIIIYQTYQDKVNQCGESGLSVLLTQSWLDITWRFNLFVFIDQDMFMNQSTKTLFQIGKQLSLLSKTGSNIRALKIPLRITGFIASKIKTSFHGKYLKCLSLWYWRILGICWNTSRLCVSKVYTRHKARWCHVCLVRKCQF